MSYIASDENLVGLLADLGIEVRQTTGNASLRCPLPGHEDSTPSFSLKVDTGEFFCHGCDRTGGPETLARLMLEDDHEACRLLIDHGYVVSHELKDIVGPSVLRDMRRDSAPPPAPRLTHYPYPDLDGQVRFRVVRREPGRGGASKSFHQEHFDAASGAWRYGRGGTEPIPFQLPALAGAVAAGDHVYVAEGEKDVLALEGAGAVATTNPGGASSWPAGWGERHFKGASVTVVVDRDEAGKGWARSVQQDLRGAVRSIQFVQAAEGKDAADHLAAGHGVDAFERADLEEATVVPWPEVIPLEEPPIPPMPLADLPEVLREHVTEVAASYQVSTDLVLVADLAQIATVTQGLAVLQVGPDWREELCLYCIGVAPSGERKSAVMEEVSRPIRDYEIEVQQRQASSIQTARALRDVGTKRVDALKKKAAASTGEARKAAEAELMVALHEQGASPTPVESRLLADDATPQALARLLADHGRIGLLGAEGGIFETLAGRYEQGVPNIDVVLKAYGGETCRVDRRGSDPLIIRRPLLSMGLLVQPDVVETAARNRAFVGRGLISRFLLTRPESMVGYRALEDEPVSDRTRVHWLQALRSLAAIGCPEDGEGSFVHFVQASPRYEMRISSSETRYELDCFRSEVERELRPQVGRYGSIASTASKAPGLAARIAGNLHLLEGGSQALQSHIPAVLMRAGCDIARASLEHHLRLFGGLAEDIALRQARLVGAWGSERPDTWLPQADILRAVRHRAGAPTSSQDLTAALSVLEDHGHARRDETTARNARKSGRAPLPRWMFRPSDGAS